MMPNDDPLKQFAVRKLTGHNHNALQPCTVACPANPQHKRLIPTKQETKEQLLQRQEMAKAASSFTVWYCYNCGKRVWTRTKDEEIGFCAFCGSEKIKREATINLLFSEMPRENASVDANI
jgi:hypothetical protein